MTRRSRADRPVEEGERDGGEEGGDPGGAETAAEGIADGVSTNNIAPPPSSTSPLWPASAFFRREDGAGPSDAWDARPFPPGGAGVFGRLLATAVRTSLFFTGGEGVSRQRRR